MTDKPERQWEYCPTCGNELDTGYECLSCELDWREWAMSLFDNLPDTPA